MLKDGSTTIPKIYHCHVKTVNCVSERLFGKMYLSASNCKNLAADSSSSDGNDTLLPAGRFPGVQTLHKSDD